MGKTRSVNGKESGFWNQWKASSHRTRLLLSISAIACCGVLAAVVWSHNRTALVLADLSRSLTPPNRSSILNLGQSGSSNQRMDIEVITIRPTGFERAQITRPKGLFGIAVENRSGLTDIVLRLDQEGGPRLRQAQLSRQNLNWKDRFDLAPGRYVLTEASHPDWKCNITITE